MDQKIKEVFQENLDINLLEVIISNSSDKEKIHKIKLRPVLIKNQVMFQVSEYRGKQIFHVNYNKEEVIPKLNECFSRGSLVYFKQAEIRTKTKTVTILISKKGTVTIKTKKHDNGKEADKKEKQILSHNREKKYILPEGIPVPFLIDLGVQNAEGKVISKRYDKFRQINRFLEFIEDILPSLPKEQEVTIIDFGCGKSYLTFAMYYYLRELKDYNVNIIGLDLKEDVIKKCNELSKEYGYEKLNFFRGDIASFEGVSSVDMVVTLHACDTATDYALHKAVKWGAKVILSVPCCQHEVNRQMNCKELEPVFKYGLIKERVAALITDALRANILEEQGYKTQILEFIDMEHTPKNILIRAVKTNQQERSQYNKMIDFFGINPSLGELLRRN